MLRRSRFSNSCTDLFSRGNKVTRDTVWAPLLVLVFCAEKTAAWGKVRCRVDTGEGRLLGSPVPTMISHYVGSISAPTGLKITLMCKFPPFPSLIDSYWFGRSSPMRLRR